MSGFSRSVSVSPVAFHIARAAARDIPFLMTSLGSDIPISKARNSDPTRRTFPVSSPLALLSYDCARENSKFIALVEAARRGAKRDRRARRTQGFRAGARGT